MLLETLPYDSAEVLDSIEAVAAYLDEVFQSEDTALINHALGVAARARGMTQIARSAGLSRESLYKALSEAGNPEFATVLRVLQAMGLKMTVAAA